MATISSRSPHLRGNSTDTDTDNSNPNSVPFPTSVMATIVPADSQQQFLTYPASRRSRDSVSLHRDLLQARTRSPSYARHVRSPASSTYSYRARPGSQQLSPVEEEQEADRSRSSRAGSSPISRRAHAISFSVAGDAACDDTFMEDITIALLSISPAQRERIERRHRALKRSRSAGTMKRAAGATGRAFSAFISALRCPTWATARRP
ncbi:hypothetical protein EWM64_g7774 [Hericium alpestre]|uniref:Uncharacterized protein n=1 Tax=Hericium alpestre TaxID=135208 RepID=A0A4Y9ZRW8_9AGAM|nr:hypothetical protein EWM64_g7774 [Hericium alpestre]